jgi:hypothetical protein
MWGRCQSGWKSERGRGTERALIFGEERFAEIFNRSDGAGLKCGFPERFAQHALGHNSKAVHRAYAKHAEVTVPSLADWEKDWQENPQLSAQPKLLPVDFRSTPLASSQRN